MDCIRREYVVLDRDAKFGSDVIEFLKASVVKPLRTSVRSPWQNGIAERWIGNCRRGMGGLHHRYERRAAESRTLRSSSDGEQQGHHKPHCAQLRHWPFCASLVAARVLQPAEANSAAVFEG